MALTPDELQQLFLLTQQLIQLKMQVEAVGDKIEDLQCDVFRIASRLIEEPLEDRGDDDEGT